MAELTTKEEVNEINKLKENYHKMLKVGEALGHLAFMLEERYKCIKVAVERIREGVEIAEAAVICKVNHLRYPDECYEKMIQMRNVTGQPRTKFVHYKMNKSKNYERQVFKYNKLEPPIDRADTDEEEEAEYNETHPKGYRYVDHFEDDYDPPGIPQNDKIKAAKMDKKNAKFAKDANTKYD